jgi:acetolactate synthase small subunit
MRFYNDAKSIVDYLDQIAAWPYRNFIATIVDIDEENMTVETDLFDKSTLVAYAKKNCNIRPTDEEMKLFSEYQGGEQGNYSSWMDKKIRIIAECLTEFPNSKRAVISTGGTFHHSDTDNAKCLREMHFYLNQDMSGKYRLNCTGIFRAQAVDIMPKNFYFVWFVMNQIKEKLLEKSELPIELGDYTHFVTTLVKTRND